MLPNLPAYREVKHIVARIGVPDALVGCEDLEDDCCRVPVQLPYAAFDAGAPEHHPELPCQRRGDVVPVLDVTAQEAPAPEAVHREPQRHPPGMLRRASYPADLVPGQHTQDLHGQLLSRTAVPRGATYIHALFPYG
jgi:hypothetical protein